MFAFDPYSPAVDADPFPYYRRLRDEHPCFWSPEAQMWVLSRYADIVSAGQDWQTYSSASGNLMTELPGRAGATLGSSDPPKHDRLRGLIQHAFMKRNLLALEEPIRAIAQQVFGPLKGAQQFDFKDVSSQFTVKVLMAALGLPLLGDRIYPTLLPEGTDDLTNPLRLLAHRVAFDDPVTGEPREFVSRQALAFPSQLLSNR